MAVDLAADGREALDLARRARYDLILMDMQMPAMNGVEAARAIRADSLNADTPILAMTASAYTEDRQACLDAGMNDHIAKPVEPVRLFDAIARLLAIPESEPAAAATGPADEDAVGLDRLPVELGMELADIAAQLDRDSTLALADRISPEHPAEARLIARLAEEFRFDRLLDLCQPFSDQGRESEEQTREG